MNGRHRAGDPVDDVGTLPILDGVIAAVEAEREGAQWRAFDEHAATLLASALAKLSDARYLIVRARDSLSHERG